jgi:hypothetical protein
MPLCYNSVFPYNYKRAAFAPSLTFVRSTTGVQTQFKKAAPAHGSFCPCPACTGPHTVRSLAQLPNVEIRFVAAPLPSIASILTSFPLVPVTAHIVLLVWMCLCSLRSRPRYAVRRRHR